MAAREPWPAVATYVSSRKAGVRYALHQRPGVAHPTPGDLYCTCAGWKFCKIVPRTCNHVARWIERDQYDGQPAPPSQTRHLLTQAGVAHQFTAHQVGVLESVFESRLLRGRLASPGAVARSAPRPAGVREIVFDDQA